MSVVSNPANLAYLVLIGVAALCILLRSYKAARIPLFSLLRTKKKGDNLIILTESRSNVTSPLSSCCTS